MKRTQHCGELRAAHVGQKVVLMGWVHARRDLGGIVFIELRDREGNTQVVFDAQHNKPAWELAQSLRSEFVVAVEGHVRKRPEGTQNLKLPTGEVEIYIREIEVLGRAGELPMPVFGDQEYPEDIRLKYRFLDLRRERLHKNIMLRGAVIDSIRRGVPAGLEEIAQLGRTLWRRRHDILAFFDHHVSNGPTEATNGRLEALRRNALGFRNLTHYRIRSLLHSGALHALVNAL